MKYSSTLIAVKDMEKSKQFYYDVLGLDVIVDFGANVILTGGICLHTVDTWKLFIHKQESEIIYEKEKLQLNNDNYLEMFEHEIRRCYPFMPFIGADVQG